MRRLVKYFILPSFMLYAGAVLADQLPQDHPVANAVAAKISGNTNSGGGNTTIVNPATSGSVAAVNPEVNHVNAVGNPRVDAHNPPGTPNSRQFRRNHGVGRR